MTQTSQGKAGTASNFCWPDTKAPHRSESGWVRVEGTHSPLFDSETAVTGFVRCLSPSRHLKILVCFAICFLNFFLKFLLAGRAEVQGSRGPNLVQTIPFLAEQILPMSKLSIP